jgi:hypothetical protein
VYAESKPSQLYFCRYIITRVVLTADEWNVNGDRMGCFALRRAKKKWWGWGESNSRPKV